AWDPIARKERWRAANAAAGPFAGGTLATAGNVVFSSVNDKLLAFRADTGEKVLELATGLTQMGPPITFQVDGRQYITVAGGPPRAAGNTAGAPQPGHLLALVLDGKPIASEPRP
ncbi:MAG: PQQ-dependent dehydrogenase, methanol/ethanol family, partial [Acidobacteriia bacterium]|nr:PQQ-dependent dehydrogenase, methanol/ethanol family [Terriglobia bacterium]